MGCCLHHARQLTPYPHLLVLHVVYQLVGSCTKCIKAGARHITGTTRQCLLHHAVPLTPPAVGQRGIQHLHRRGQASRHLQAAPHTPRAVVYVSMGPQSPPAAACNEAAPQTVGTAPSSQAAHQLQCLCPHRAQQCREVGVAAHPR